ncbi:DsrE family protein [Shewanella aestuarii]|uniref:DsrE family protein n=1 Tax=Shewanella aestuarii TaxID=1028752 RepID=A0A6G9QLT4_9GAMM|nr:DsrE family protein [Shewanella aestuarii]QIR15348.1 DsrE family protein [Shewanella aestuarii]
MSACLSGLLKIVLISCYIFSYGASAAEVTSASVSSGFAAFSAGPVIKDFGKIAKVDSNLAIPAKMKFKVAFDLGKASDVGKVNRQIDTLARFINMHVDAGVKLEDIELAMVVHGKAAIDMTKNAFYKQANSSDANVTAGNANATLIHELTKYQVKFYVCGQTAAYYGISPADLLPGVDMALSALTAHAILSQQGFSSNPF